MRSCQAMSLVDPGLGVWQAQGGSALFCQCFQRCKPEPHLFLEPTQDMRQKPWSQTSRQNVVLST